MSRLTALAVACLLILPTIAFAEPAEAELPSLSRLVIVSGEPTLPGALPSLTADAKLIAANFEGATALTDRSTLVVGVKSEKPAGTVLARAEFASDCPDNSMFQVKEQVVEAVSPETLNAALVAWTRHRHDAAKAPVRSTREMAYHYLRGAGRFIDVSLDLKQVSAR